MKPGVDRKIHQNGGGDSIISTYAFILKVHMYHVTPTYFLSSAVLSQNSPPVLQLIHYCTAEGAVSELSMENVCYVGHCLLTHREAGKSKTATYIP